MLTEKMLEENFFVKADDFDRTRYLGNASDLFEIFGRGYPNTIKTDLGNLQLFEVVDRDCDHEGDLMWVLYRQPGTRIELRVFND